MCKLSIINISMYNLCMNFFICYESMRGSIAALAPSAMVEEATRSAVRPGPGEVQWCCYWMSLMDVISAYERWLILIDWYGFMIHWWFMNGLVLSVLVSPAFCWGLRLCPFLACCSWLSWCWHRPSRSRTNPLIRHDLPSINHQKTINRPRISHELTINYCS